MGTNFRTTIDSIMIDLRDIHLRTPLLAAALAMAALLGGCTSPAYLSSGLVTEGVGPLTVVGSGHPVERELPIEDFSEVEVGSALEVAIVPSEGYSITITGDDNVVELVQATQQGQLLKLDLKPGSYHNVNLQARIGMPELRRLTLTSAARASLSEFPSSDSLSLRLSAASKLMGRLKGGDLKIDASEASSVNLGGKVDRLTLAGSSASQANLGDLAVNEGAVSLREGSSATVNVGARLDADLRSGSRLYYLGSPILQNVTAVEGSSLKRR